MVTKLFVLFKFSKMLNVFEKFFKNKLFVFETRKDPCSKKQRVVSGSRSELMCLTECRYAKIDYI